MNYLKTNIAKLVILLLLIYNIQLCGFEECDFVIDKELIRDNNYVLIFKQMYSSQEYKSFKNKRMMNNWIKKNIKKNKDIEFYYTLTIINSYNNISLNE